MTKTLTTPAKTVAIIGAGMCGMAVAKACIEHDLKPLVFERTKFVGGLWRYRDLVESGQASVMQNTIVNSSKEMTAFSDFPFPSEYPNFMPNNLMYKYLLDYANSFNFFDYVLFEQEVIQIEHCTEPAEGYLITVKHIPSGSITTNRYDAVAVCSGHNHTPNNPCFPDQNQFQGQIVHSHEVRNSDMFKDKCVVVVGIGNSGGDVAVEAAPVARQVYLSSRRGGTWLIKRTGLNGQPIDTVNGRRLLNRALHLLPYPLRCTIVENLMQKMIGHDLLGLRPEGTRFFGQHVMVNDHIPTYIHLGWIKMRYNIERFTPNGVVFKGDNNHVTKCDIVVMATGYQCTFPYLYPAFDSNARYRLYKHVFDPAQPKPERMAFIGLPKANGSLPPIAEIQSRWFVMLLKNICKPLPSVEKMLAQTDRIRKRIAYRFGADNVDKHLFEVEMMYYMDSLARSAGLMPNICSYLIKDPKLWWALLTKPCISAQYRLQGCGSKPKQARKLILTTKDRIKAPYVKSTLLYNDDTVEDEITNN